MVALTRAGDRLQRALEGGAVHPDVAADVMTAHAVAGLTLAVLPDTTFVGALRERLLAEATALSPERAQPMPSRAEGAARQPVQRPAVVRVGGGRGRLVAGVLACIAVVALVVGIAGRGALPGQSLYPVRELLDGAAVALAGSDHGKGLTLLDQADRHIGEAAQLAAAAAPVELHVTTAVGSAIGSFTQAGRLLTDDFEKTGDVQSLVAMDDFTNRAIPTVDSLAGVVPTGVRGLVTQLHGLLDEVRTDVISRLAACTACGHAGDEARRLLQSGAPTTSAPTTSAPTTSTTGSATSAPASSGTSASSGRASSGSSTSLRPTTRTTSSGRPTGTGGGTSPSATVTSSASVTSGTGGVTLPTVTVSITVPFSTLTTGVGGHPGGGITGTLPGHIIPTLPMSSGTISVPTGIDAVPRTCGILLCPNRH